MSEKKKKVAAGGKEKKETKEKKKSSKTKDSDTPAPPSAPAAATAVPAPGSLEFEAGLLFSKYDKGNGSISPDDFLQIWREKENRGMPQPALNPSAPSSLNAAAPSSSAAAPVASVAQNPFAPPMHNPSGALGVQSAAAFEAGKLFSRFDYDRDGKLDKREFEDLVNINPELMAGNIRTSLGRPLALEYRLITHYDETACIGIPTSAVDQHRALGNVVLPLNEAYARRYEKLASSLTGKLFPRRHQLMQLKDRLNFSLEEIEATRRAIEKETIADTEQILDRLRNAESLRQSAIKHQMLQLEKELNSIKLVVDKVEIANAHVHQNSIGGTNGLMLSSAATGQVLPESDRSSKSDAMISLIHQSSDLLSKIDRLANKTLMVQIDFPSNDFPRETAERLEIAAKADKYVHALAVKDQMLWTTIKEREELAQQLEAERTLNEKYLTNLQEYALTAKRWKDITENLKQEKGVLLNRIDDLVEVLRRHNIHYEFE